MSSKGVIRKGNNNRMYKFLMRDVPSVSFNTAKSITGHLKVYLIDVTRGHREVAYCNGATDVTEVKNELAVSYMVKFNTEFNVMSLATPHKRAIR